jgi:hypothetical protein
VRFFRPTPIPVELEFPQPAVEYILGEVTLGQVELYGWNFLEANELSEIVREKDNLYIIATHEEYGMLCVRSGDASGFPIYLDDHDSDGIVIDYSLITFLKKTPEEREK